MSPGQGGVKITEHGLGEQTSVATIIRRIGQDEVDRIRLDGAAQHDVRLFVIRFTKGA